MKSLWFLLGWIILTPALAAAQVKVSEIKTERLGDNFQVRLGFDGGVEREEVEVSYIDQTVQFDFQQLQSAKEEPQTISVSDSVVESIYAYQVDPKTYRVRLTLKSEVPAISYINKIKTEVRADGFYLRLLGHPTANVEDGTQWSEPQESEDAHSLVLTSDGVAPQEDEVKDGTAPFVEESEIELFQAKEDQPLVESLGKGAPALLIVSVGMILLLGGFYFLRKWVRKSVGDNSSLKIKIIGQHYLGPRKSLAVVRVAGESILVGITDQNITCIKALSLLDEELPAPETSASFSESLKDQEDSQDSEDKDNFAVTALTDIKDRVSTKLREMREL